MAGSIEAVAFDLLTALVDSWTLYARVGVARRRDEPGASLRFGGRPRRARTGRTRTSSRMPRTTRACQLVLSAERAGAYKTDLRAYRAALDALYDEPDLRRLAEVA